MTPEHKSLFGDPCIYWRKYLRVASEETVSEASQEARGEDGDVGVCPECHHHPGEDAGHCRGYQQLLGAKPLLEEPTSHSEYDGRDVLGYPNDGVSHRVLLFLLLISDHVVVMFDQDSREVSIDTAERFHNKSDFLRKSLPAEM